MARQWRSLVVNGGGGGTRCEPPRRSGATKARPRDCAVYLADSARHRVRTPPIGSSTSTRRCPCLLFRPRSLFRCGNSIQPPTRRLVRRHGTVTSSQVRVNRHLCAACLVAAGLRQSRRSSRLPGSFPIGDGPPRATGQRWPLLTATYGIGHQGRIRQNAGALLVAVDRKSVG